MHRLRIRCRRATTGTRRRHRTRTDSSRQERGGATRTVSLARGSHLVLRSWQHRPVTIVGILLRPLVWAVTWRRWVYLVLGGAILVPYAFAAAYPLSIAVDRNGAVSVAALAGTIALVLVAVAITSLLEAVRQVEVVAAKQLLRGPLMAQLVPVSVTGADRARAGLFFSLHLVCWALRTAPPAWVRSSPGWPRACWAGRPRTGSRRWSASPMTCPSATGSHGTCTTRSGTR